MRLEEFDYNLPEERIAQTPLADRSASRLLVVDPQTSHISHEQYFSALLKYLKPGDVMVFNDSRVIPARLFAYKEDTGAKIELLLLKSLEANEWLTLAKPAKRLKVGSRLRFYKSTSHDAEGDERIRTAHAEVVDTAEDGIRTIRFQTLGSVEELLSLVGVMPLPPYIHEQLENQERYQTVYARTSGSVAAPTAGLHFTEELLKQIDDMGVEVHYVTLHVGLGTFRPVQVEDIESHKMHSEWYEVNAQTAAAIEAAKNRGNRVIAVGTTALRTLESAGASGAVRPGSGDTDIFIYPGYRFRIVDALITNFHLPKSTLVMLVAAFMGRELTMRAYREAVDLKYRFFSFGDAMLITGRSPS